LLILENKGKQEEVDVSKKPRHLKKINWVGFLVRGVLCFALLGLSLGLWMNLNEEISKPAWLQQTSRWLQEQWQVIVDEKMNAGLSAAAEEEKAAPAFSRGVGAATSKDTLVLAKLINGEARGESYVGQVAVGAVVINRTKNPNFPNTVYGVVFEPGAFDAVKDGQYYQEPTDSALRAAKDAIGGWDPSSGAIYYWNPVTATSKWIWSRPIITRIGKHVFAK
jgi:N-acetylmuramoyl-L-alanine amidase